MLSNVAEVAITLPGGELASETRATIIDALFERAIQKRRFETSLNTMLRSIPELQSLAMWGLADLLDWAAARQIHYGLERSVRFHLNCFETRRILVSFAIGEIGGNALSEIVRICRAMKAPENHIQSLSRFFTSAAFVHFGFEFSGDIVVGKCYLELPPPAENAVATSGRLQFLGFKWSMNQSSMAVVTRYRILQLPAWNDVKDIMLKNSGVALQPVMNLMFESLLLNQPRNVPIPTVLEIEEEGSGRKSFDLNLYDFDRKVSHVADSILSASSILDLDKNAVECWLKENSGTQIGHIATGFGRDQRSFITIYYGLT